MAGVIRRSPAPRRRTGSSETRWGPERRGVLAAPHRQLRNQRTSTRTSSSPSFAAGSSEKLDIGRALVEASLHRTERAPEMGWLPPRPPRPPPRCRTGSSEDNQDRPFPEGNTSLPHGQLERRIVTWPQAAVAPSLPHRQLRNGNQKCGATSGSSLPHEQLRKNLRYVLLTDDSLAAAQAAQKKNFFGFGDDEHPRCRTGSSENRQREGRAAGAPRCRTGSSESEGDIGHPIFFPRCRTGSSENRLEDVWGSVDPRCRTGSSETFGQGRPDVGSPRCRTGSSEKFKELFGYGSDPRCRTGSSETACLAS